MVLVTPYVMDPMGPAMTYLPVEKTLMDVSILQTLVIIVMDLVVVQTIAVIAVLGAVQIMITVEIVIYMEKAVVVAAITAVFVMGPVIKVADAAIRPLIVMEIAEELV